MGWLPQSAFDKIKDKIRAMTSEQANNLTWEQAYEFVPKDTLCLAHFQGLERRNEVTPYKALLIVNNML